MPTPASECINPDDFLQTPAGRVWTPERNKHAWAQAFTALRLALSHPSERALPYSLRPLYVVCGIQGAGKTTWIRNNWGRLAPCVFFDAALPRAIHRAPLVKMAEEAGTRAYAVWVVASVSQALSRNAQRTEDERVPESAIRAVAEQFEEPTVAEGFVNVLNIRTE